MSKTKDRTGKKFFSNPKHFAELVNVSKLNARFKTNPNDLQPQDPVVKPTLEQAIQFIKDDELVEVTPNAIRMCKKILDTQKRKIFNNRGEIPEYLN